MHRPTTVDSQQPLTARLSADDITRYSRHILLPEVGIKGQERLKAARVLIVGVGGLGSPAALYLAAAGIGTIGLVDFDVIDRSNLQRQVLYADRDIGRPKVDVAAERLRAQSPGTTVEVFAEQLTSKNARAIIDAFDLVLDGTDNFLTRYLVSDVCVLLGKPYVYGSIFKFDGQLSVFEARHGPCYRCLFPSPPPAEQAPNCAEAGVLGVLPGLVGVMQATEALKHVLGIGASLRGRLLLIDALTMNFSEIKISKDPQCPSCGVNTTMTMNNLDKPTPPGASPIGQCETGSAALGDDVNVQQLKRWRDEQRAHTLLDVRGPAELDICRIQGSLNIPMPELADRLGEIDRSLPLVVHCKSGGRSTRAVAFLQQQGFDQAINLKGGIMAWIDAIEPQLPKY